MPDQPHIVDVLIAERAPRLSRSWLWPLVRPVLNWLLGYRGARSLADEVAARGGYGAMAYASDLLHLQVEAVGLEHVPRTGRFIAVINHPTGLADGVAVYDALKPIRPDLIFFANSDAHRVNPRLDEVFIPVEWVEAKRTRERTRVTLEQATRALEAERPILIFPAGRIARREGGVLEDPPWMASAVSIARRHKAPVLPIRLEGPPSTLFWLFDRVSVELRDITLFHELLNKAGKRFRLVVGPPISSEAIGRDSEAFTNAVKHYVEHDLAQDPAATFPSPPAGEGGVHTEHSEGVGG
jgi:putative hemolysin